MVAGLPVTIPLPRVIKRGLANFTGGDAPHISGQLSPTIPRALRVSVLSTMSKLSGFLSRFSGCRS